MKRVFGIDAFFALMLCVGHGYSQTVSHSPEPVGFNAWDVIQAHFSGGSLAIIGTMVTIYLNLRKVLRPALKSISLRLDEHDIMWEEYNIRNGGSFRIERGRNGTAPRLHDKDVGDNRTRAAPVQFRN